MIIIFILSLLAICLYMLSVNINLREDIETERTLNKYLATQIVINTSNNFQLAVEWCSDNEPEVVIAEALKRKGSRY